MSNYLTSMPSQIIRDAVTSILESFNSALSINEMESFISEELEMPHPIHTSEEISYLHTILNDMAAGGRIEIKNKMMKTRVNVRAIKRRKETVKKGK